MFTKMDFGIMLKEKVIRKDDVIDIARWAYSFYLEHDELEDGFDDILLALNAMEDGPEFEFSYEELEKIADDLIAGKAIKL